MNWKQVCELAAKLPGVVETTSYGTPALKLRGKLLARVKEDGESIMFRLTSIEEREYLIASKPRVYFVTDHYRDYPAVLAHLRTLRASECEERIHDVWRAKAPKSLLNQHFAERAAKRRRA